MPTPPFNMNVDQSFPMGSVIQAAQQNAQRQLEAQTLGNQSIVQGLQAIGQVGQSLLDRRRAMAQALAGAQLYSNTPEGKEMLGTNQVTSGPNGQPVTMNQTASGSVDQPPQPNKPSIDLQTLATAFMGDKPSDVMTQMFNQHKFGVESQQKQQEIGISQLLASIAGQKAGTEQTHTNQEDINTLLQRRQEASANLPTGFFNSINNDKAKQAQSTIADIDRQLAAKGYKGALAPVSGNQGAISSQKFTSQNGTSYTVN